MLESHQQSTSWFPKIFHRQELPGGKLLPGKSGQYRRWETALSARLLRGGEKERSTIADADSLDVLGKRFHGMYKDNILILNYFFI